MYANLKENIEKREDLRSSFHPVDMFPKDIIARIPPISLIEGWKNSVVAKKRFNSLIRREGAPFDAAYCYQHTYIMFQWKFRKHVPYVLAMDGVPLWYLKHKLWYTHQEFDPESRLSRIKHSLNRSVYAGAFHLLPISNGVRECLIEDYGIPEEKVTVLPPGLDLTSWNFPERQERRIADPQRPLNVLLVGAEYIRKGGDLVASLARRQEFREIEFHFVMKNYAGEGGRNIFVHEDITPNSPRLMELYRNADIFVLPTRQDTHSFSALEAMAMGLPVISTPIGGIVDIIVEGRTGYFVPTDDVETLADRLRRLIASRELRFEMGESGRRRMQKHFNISTNVDSIIAILKRAANRDPFNGTLQAHPPLDNTI